MDYADLLQPKIQEFILKNTSSDPHRLLLKHREICGVDIREIVSQILSRKKAQHKLPDWYAAEQVLWPPLLSMEQCSSETAARLKSGIAQGKSLIDLTGGAGVDTYYLSQEFSKVHYIERNKDLAQLTAHNFRILEASHIQCHNVDAEVFLSQLKEQQDWIYLDPARRDKSDTDKKVYHLSDCEPDINKMLPELLDKAKNILLKTAPLLDIDSVTSTLKQVSKVYVIALQNECKEVLYHLSRTTESEPELISIHVPKKGAVQEFRFLRSEEKKLSPSDYHLPLTYLFEPNSALLKAGAFKSIAERFSLHKLHRHSHLYTSETYREGFPGRAFRIEQTLRYHKKDIRKALPSGKANITIRNFPVSVQDIRKKTGLKEGGDDYLFATTLHDGQKAILHCIKMD